MINIKQAKRFCKEDISKIKNYDKAIADTTQVWDCHHMTETWWNCSKKDLIENECYYHRKACELVFLTPLEHNSLHKKGKTTWNKGKTTSIFGKAFQEHFGLTKSDNKKLYMKEYMFYMRNGKFSWN